MQQRRITQYPSGRVGKDDKWNPHPLTHTHNAAIQKARLLSQEFMNSHASPRMQKGGIRKLECNVLRTELQRVSLLVSDKWHLVKQTELDWGAINPKVVFNGCTRIVGIGTAHSAFFLVCEPQVSVGRLDPCDPALWGICVVEKSLEDVCARAHTRTQCIHGKYRRRPCQCHTWTHTWCEGSTCHLTFW